MAILDLYESQEGRCAYCSGPLRSKFHVDHKTPLSRGGAHALANLCCACGRCNIAKRDKTADEFVAYLAARHH